MPSFEHEMLIGLFRKRPMLAAELLESAFQLELPRFECAQVESGDLTQCTPVQYQADLVVTLKDEAGAIRTAFIVEVQRSRDKDKRWSWPVYLTSMRARVKCPAILVVFCPSRRVARWCSTPIDLGPGSVVRPLVVGPDAVPVVTDLDEALRSPELATLSGLVHGAGEHGHRVLETTFDALTKSTGDADDVEPLYLDFLLAVLPVAARTYLEKLMTAFAGYQPQSPWAKRFYAEGRVEGKVEGKVEGRVEGEANAILAVLSVRGIEVPADARTKILDCTDIALLDEWVRRAVTVETVDGLFG